MSIEAPPRLCDLPVGMLEAILPALEVVCPEPQFDTDSLTDEKQRLKIATDRGRRSVLIDIKRAIAQRHTEAKKPRVLEEVI